MGPNALSVTRYFEVQMCLRKKIGKMPRQMVKRDQNFEYCGLLHCEIYNSCIWKPTGMSMEVRKWLGSVGL